MISMTSIEEIVKYQQELLNHQRNQKLIQRETIKLLNALNKNITLMLDRLDEFAFKTNIKLEDGGGNETESYFSLANATGYYEHNTTSSSISNTTNHLNSSLNSNEDIKEYYVLSDCHIDQQQPMLVIQQDQLFADKSNVIKVNCATPNSVATNKTTKATASPNRTTASSSRPSRSSKLLDTTNTTATSRTVTSDESIDDDATCDETSDDEKETIQVKKKPRTSSSNVNSNNNPPPMVKIKELDESNNQQRLFNKYVRESVERRLGKEFLLLHEIQEIDHDIMEDIKKDALQAYPPINIRPRRAWHLAKASLRCRRRSLRRQKEKQTLGSSSADNTLNIIDSSLVFPIDSPLNGSATTTSTTITMTTN